MLKALRYPLWKSHEIDISDVGPPEEAATIHEKCRSVAENFVAFFFERLFVNLRVWHKCLGSPLISYIIYNSTFIFCKYIYIYIYLCQTYVFIYIYIYIHIYIYAYILIL